MSFIKNFLSGGLHAGRNRRKGIETEGSQAWVRAHAKECSGLYARTHDLFQVYLRELDF